MEGFVRQLVAILLLLSSCHVVSMLEINDDVELKPTFNVKTRYNEMIYNGAQQLRSAPPALQGIPQKLQTELYDKLQEQFPTITDNIKALEGILQDLPAIKADIEKKTPVKKIKEPLLAAFAKLETTLPVLLGTLKELEKAFLDTFAEAKVQVPQVADLIKRALEVLDNKDGMGRNLAARMEALANFLRSFAI